MKKIIWGAALLISLSNFIFGAAIIGRVTDPEGQPVSDVKIIVYYRGVMLELVDEVTTDTNGNYKFTNLPPKSYWIKVIPPSESFLLPPPDYNNVVVTSEETKVVNFQLELGGKIKGKITGPDGSAVRADVECRQGENFIGRTRSAANGEYELVVSPGVYSLKVTPLNGVTQLAPATKESITVEVERIIIVNFQLKIGGRITGRVTGPDGQPLEGIQVVGTRFAFTDETGAYKFVGLASGTYSITAGGHPSPWAAVVKNVVISEGEEIVIDFQLLEIGGEIVGKVTDSNGQPVSRGVVYVQSSSQPSLRVFAGSITDKGEYKILGLPAGIYTVTADVPPDIHTVTAQDIVMKKEDIRVELGETTRVDFQLPDTSVSKKEVVNLINQSSPNPFNLKQCFLNKIAGSKLRVYNILGQLVGELADFPELPSGVYFYEIHQRDNKRRGSFCLVK
jgi:protocatechuate 3,4-dioxygenase beta subunit